MCICNYRRIWCHFPEYSALHSHHCDGPESQILAGPLTDNTRIQFIVSWPVVRKRTILTVYVHIVESGGEKYTSPLRNNNRVSLYGISWQDHAMQSSCKLSLHIHSSTRSEPHSLTTAPSCSACARNLARKVTAWGIFPRFSKSERITYSACFRSKCLRFEGRINISFFFYIL
jgi:hypothetical protein